MSDPQKDQGYLLPDPIEGWELICVTLKIPDTPEYRSAFRGALKSLTEWHKWQRTGDTKGSQAATYLRQIIDEHLVIDDCDPFEDCGDDMGKFKLCWHSTEDGWVLRWTINGECTWEDVGDCETDAPIYFPTPSPVTPVPPIDDPGTTPTPDFEPNLRCKIAMVGMEKVFGTSDYSQALYEFVVIVIGSATSGAIGANLMIWLKNRNTQTGLTYIQYYELFKALATKHYPNKANIESQLESATFSEAICSIYDCIPDTGIIERSVLDCIGDYWLSRKNAPGQTTAGQQYFDMIYDFTNIFPLEWARYHALEASGAEEQDCSSCVDEPDPEVCGIYTPFIWSDVALEDLLGWNNFAAGDPKSWAIDDADFDFASVVYPMGKTSSGWRLDQGSAEPYRAGFAWDEFDDPFNLCDFFARITTKTGRGNTRMAVAWYRQGGLWVPMVGKRININDSGDVDLSWKGTASNVDALLIGVTVGRHSAGSWIQIGNIYLNSTLA